MLHLISVIYCIKLKGARHFVCVSHTILIDNMSKNIIENNEYVHSRLNWKEPLHLLSNRTGMEYLKRGIRTVSTQNGCMKFFNETIDRKKRSDSYVEKRKLSHQIESYFNRPIVSNITKRSL